MNNSELITTIEPDKSYELDFEFEYHGLNYSEQTKLLENHDKLKEIYGEYTVVGHKSIETIIFKKGDKLWEEQFKVKIITPLPKITKKERIYLSIGLATFGIVFGSLLPFPANLFSLVSVPIILEQIKFIRR